MSSRGTLQLTAEDMESLRSQLPDLALTISSPDLNSITQFFLSKSLTSTEENNKEKDTASMRVDVATHKEQERARAPMLFDRLLFGLILRNFNKGWQKEFFDLSRFVSGVVSNRRRTRRSSRRSGRAPRTLNRSRSMARNKRVRSNWRLVPREASPPLPRPRLTYPRLIRKSRT